MLFKKKPKIIKNHSTYKKNVYQEIVDRYENQNIEYRGAQTVDRSIATAINKFILWTIIILQFIAISVFFFIYLFFVVASNNNVLKIWIIGGLDDVLFHWCLFIICTVFSLLLCSLKNQIYYYYVLWILFAIHSLWDSSDAIYWLFNREQIISYHGQIEGQVFNVSLWFEVYSLSSNLLILLLASLGVLNLADHYIPTTDFGKWIKSKQIYYQNKWFKKQKSNHQKFLKKQHRKRNKKS